ncbi:unnamed protein product, partial [Mesorhabditis spiculigera]
MNREKRINPVSPLSAASPRHRIPKKMVADANLDETSLDQTLQPFSDTVLDTTEDLDCSTSTIQEQFSNVTLSNVTLSIDPEIYKPDINLDDTALEQTFSMVGTENKLTLESLIEEADEESGEEDGSEEDDNEEEMNQTLVDSTLDDAAAHVEEAVQFVGLSTVDEESNDAASEKSPTRALPLEPLPPIDEPELSFTRHDDSFGLYDIPTNYEEFKNLKDGDDPARQREDVAWFQETLANKTFEEAEEAEETNDMPAADNSNTGSRGKYEDFDESMISFLQHETRAAEAVCNEQQQVVAQLQQELAVKQQLIEQIREETELLRQGVVESDSMFKSELKKVSEAHKIELNEQRNELMELQMFLEDAQKKHRAESEIWESNAAEKAAEYEKLTNVYRESLTDLVDAKETIRKLEDHILELEKKATEEVLGESLALIEKQAELELRIKELELNEGETSKKLEKYDENLMECNRKLEESKAKIEAFEQQVVELEKYNLDLVQERDALQEKIAAAQAVPEEALLEYQQDLESLRSEMAKKSADAEKLQQEYDDILVKWNAATATINNLEDRLTVEVNVKQGLLDEKKVLEEECSTFRKLLEEAETKQQEEIVLLRAEIAQKTEEADALRREHQTKLAGVEATVEELETRLRADDNTNKGLLDEKMQLENEVSEARRLLEESQQKSQQEIAVLEQRIAGNTDELRAEIDALAKQLDDARSGLEGMTRRADDLAKTNDELTEGKRQSQEEVDECQREMAALEEKLSTLSSQLAEKSSAMDLLKAEHERTTAEKQTMSEAIADQVKQLQEQTALLDDQKSLCADYEQRLAEAEARDKESLHRAEEEIEKLNILVLQLNKDKDLLVDDNKTMTGTLDNIRAKLETTTEKLHMTEERLTSSEIQLMDSETQFARTQAALEDEVEEQKRVAQSLKAEMASKAEETEQLLVQNADVVEKLKEAEAKMQNMQTRLEEQLQEIRSLQEEKNGFNEEIERLGKQLDEVDDLEADYLKQISDLRNQLYKPKNEAGPGLLSVLKGGVEALSPDSIHEDHGKENRATTPCTSKIESPGVLHTPTTDRTMGVELEATKLATPARQSEKRQKRGTPNRSCAQQ